MAEDPDPIVPRRKRTHFVSSADHKPFPFLLTLDDERPPGLLSSATDEEEQFVSKYLKLAEIAMSSPVRKKLKKTA